MKEKFWGLPPWQQGLILLTGAVILILTVLWLIRVRQALFAALTPFFISLAMAYLLFPLVNFMERRRLSRPLAIAVLYLLFTLIIFIVCVRVAPLFLDDLEKLTRQMPDYSLDLQKFIHRVEAG